MSIFDWLISLLVAVLVGYFFKIRGFIWIPFLFAWILLGVAVHSYFGVNTMLGYYLGINPIYIREECI